MVRANQVKEKVSAKKVVK